MRRKLCAAGVAAMLVGGATAANAECYGFGPAGRCAAPQQPSRWNEPAFGYYQGRGAERGASYGAASHMGPDPGGGFFHMGNSTIGRTD